MEHKYVYANIRLPIELSEDGSFEEIFSNRMTIDFELCEQLPDVCDYDKQKLIGKIFSLHTKISRETVSPIENDIKITTHDLKKRTPRKRQNISFKKRENKGQYTRRVY
jgi:hypothetical protein